MGNNRFMVVSEEKDIIVMKDLPGKRTKIIFITQEIWPGKMKTVIFGLLAELTMLSKVQDIESDHLK